MMHSAAGLQPFYEYPRLSHFQRVLRLLSQSQFKERYADLYHGSEEADMLIPLVADNRGFASKGDMISSRMSESFGIMSKYHLFRCTSE